MEKTSIFTYIIWQPTITSNVSQAFTLPHSFCSTLTTPLSQRRLQDAPLSLQTRGVTALRQKISHVSHPAQATPPLNHASPPKQPFYGTKEEEEFANID